MNGNSQLMHEWFNKAEHDVLNAQIILESRRAVTTRYSLFFCRHASAQPLDETNSRHSPSV